MLTRVARGGYAGRSDTALREWISLPRRINRAISGLSARELDARGGSEGWSIREYVHHLVESNLVTATIVLAAVGSPGCRYDWAWLVPDAAWVRRLGYGRLGVERALRLLDALVPHVASLARRNPRAHVRLTGTSGATRRRAVRELLEEECAHARHHVAEIRDIRSRSAKPPQPRSETKTRPGGRASSRRREG